MQETTCNAEGDAWTLLYSTCPDAACAERIAETLVAERLAACANLLPGMRSVYRWEGRIERAEEVVLLLKTSRARAAEAMARVAALHPYQVPCVIELPLGAVHAPYAAWMRGEL